MRKQCFLFDILQNTEMRNNCLFQKDRVKVFKQKKTHFVFVFTWFVNTTFSNVSISSSPNETLLVSNVTF